VKMRLAERIFGLAQRLTDNFQTKAHKRHRHHFGVETPVKAAVREAMEEAGINLADAKATPIGARNMNRPFDVRVAKGNGLEEKYGIKDGDVFMVSTQVIRFDVPDLEHTPLIAGDDAEPGTARRVKLSSLTRDEMGIPDHFDMIRAAIPECFAAEAPQQRRAAPQPPR
jgi:8-oxo-dGTP pyrophosphatase MutT (NUDIX family)